MKPLPFAGLFLGILAALATWPGAIRADAIDGNWCNTKGKHLSISGPRIVTPGGTRMEGAYDRHGFAYTVPAGEKGAGANVTMHLLDEETMQFKEGDVPREIWERCRPIS